MDSSGSVVKNLFCNAGNVGSIPGWGTKVPTCQGAANPMHHDQRVYSPRQRSCLIQVRLDMAEERNDFLKKRKCMCLAPGYPQLIRAVGLIQVPCDFPQYA